MPPKISTSDRAPVPAEGSGSAPASKLAAGLHIVATPIGNAADITLRALRTLSDADVIACEDTRVTGRLTRIHQIATPLLSYHEHNAERMRPLLIARMKAGQAVALVSDAGTPLISDPGYKLVRACVAEGVAVTALPGPSAALTGLVLSGLPSDRFLFAGFLPNRSSARRTAIGELAQVPATLIFYESAQRLAACLGDLAALLPNREAAVARELTKLFEEVRRGPLLELAAHYHDAGPPKGEVVIVVAPPPAPPDTDADEIDRLLVDALERSSVRDAASEVAALTGQARRALYARALELAKEEELAKEGADDDDAQ